MRACICFLVLAGMAGSAMSAEVMDGSDSAFGEAVANQIAESLLTTANDPYSVQIIRLHKGANDQICAFVNLKNQSGGYTGFQPFYLISSSKEGQLLATTDCQ